MTERSPELPDEKRLRVYGDFLFLALRSEHHRRMPVGALQIAVEPPIMLGQYFIFRFDGVPRGLVTWARFGEDAEARYIAGEPMQPGDWASGDRLWIVDLIAPYKGLTAGIVRWIMQGNLPERRFRFRRVVNGNQTRRIVHIDLDRHDTGSVARVLPDAPA